MRKPSDRPTGFRPAIFARTVNYYFLALAASIASFFLTWAILDDIGERSPWIGAGLIASSVIASAVLIRELIVRANRRRQIAQQTRLDETLIAAASIRKESSRKKLTIEQNSEWERFLKKRSDAARVLDHVAEAHREVYELCGQYLSEVRSEISTAGTGSPRIAAFTKGLTRITRMHHYHMTKWAEIESKQSIAKIGNRVNIHERFRLVGRAESALNLALSYYPNDPILEQSHIAVSKLIESLNSDERFTDVANNDIDGELEIEAKAIPGEQSAPSDPNNPRFEFGEDGDTGERQEN